jgi:hypothetical protein
VEWALAVFGVSVDWVVLEGPQVKTVLVMAVVVGEAVVVLQGVMVLLAMLDLFIGKLGNYDKISC